MKKNIIILIMIVLLVTGCGKSNAKSETKKESKVEENKISIIDMNSKTRPYGVVINNFPSAVKAQTGLNKAYLVYEFPIEGGISRSLALYKDVDDVKVGTIRSARQNYLDYALENDAILIHFGGNFKANEDIPNLGIDHVDGNVDSPFYRENPLGLASEHTAYGNLKDIISYSTNNKGHRQTTDVLPPLDFTSDNVELGEAENSVVANNITIQYGYPYVVKYKYNSESKKYERYVNDELHVDYFTKEVFDTKNIIVIKVNTGALTGHTDTAGSNYLNIDNIGSGSGYYITNGYAKEINWSKESRESQTKYTYLDGSNVKINDGNTYVMFSPSNQNLTIE